MSDSVDYDEFSYYISKVKLYEVDCKKVSLVLYCSKY